MDPEKAEKTITLSFPDLEVRSIEPLEGGWDNYVFLVNRNMVFRFPIKEEFIPSMKAEVELLSRMDDFPVGLPVYRYVSDSDPFFAGYGYIEGVPLHRVSVITDGIERDMISIIEYLQEFDVSRIRSTGIPTETPQSWRSKFSNVMENFRRSLSGHLKDDVFEEAHSQIDSLFSKIPESSFTRVHSDMYRGNVLVRKDFSGINAVIDWQEASVGDIAEDVAALAVDFGTEFTSRLVGRTISKKDPDAFHRARLYQKIEPFHILEHRLEHNEFHDVKNIINKIEKSFLEKN